MTSATNKKIVTVTNFALHPRHISARRKFVTVTIFWALAA